MREEQYSVSVARRTAYRFLLRVETEDSYTSYLLQSEAMGRMNPADRRLTTELVLGALRWQRRLDWIIENYAGREIDDVDLEARVILRMAFYQLKYLTKIPAFAVVNESVELTKAMKQPHLAGFVNAILRRSQHDPEIENRMALIKDKVRRVSVKGSHPEWLVARWLDRYGEEKTQHWLQLNNSTPVTTLHTNWRKTTPDAVQDRLRQANIECSPSPYFSDAWRVLATPAAVTQLTQEGLVHLQDEGSRMVPVLLGECRGLQVLDLCSAPGGKCLNLSQAVGEQGQVLATDLYDWRLQIVTQRAALLGCSNLWTVVADATRELPLRASMDAVLVDAPCSGLGTIRRNPEIKWKVEAEDFAGLAESQRALLERAATAVKNGGRLLYSTCSTEPEENEAVVGGFLQDHPEFIHARPALTPAIEKFYDEQTGYFRTFPAEPQVDGFFAALLCKPITLEAPAGTVLQSTE